MIAKQVVFFIENKSFRYQYSGNKARFSTEEGWQIVRCLDHKISDFALAAKFIGLILEK